MTDKQNNYERIKNMTVEEMAEHYMRLERAIFEGAKRGLAENGIQISGFSEPKRLEIYKQWLLQEVEE